MDKKKKIDSAYKLQIHMIHKVSSICKNPQSYGSVCVRCGACGRQFRNEELIKENLTI